MQPSDATLSSPPRSDSPTLGPWAESQDETEMQPDVVVDLDFSQPPPSAALLVFAASRARMTTQPNESLSVSSLRDDWSSDVERGVSPSSAYIVDSPTSPSFSAPVAPSFLKNALQRSASEEDSVDSAFPARSPTAQTLPDPSQFPDPYPNRPPHWPATPALSSADSSSGSTRSSAYTNSAKSGDYGHVHVALGGEDAQQAMGLSRDDVVQLLSKVDTSPIARARFTSDQARWSDYAKSVSSRSSSAGNRKSEAQESIHGALRATPSFDMGWRPLDERDEAGLASEVETDDYLSLDEDEKDDDDDTSEEEPTSAMLVAEEGRGIIVRGDDTPVVRLQVQSGTTHLLIGSSSTPNAVPSFLANTLPQTASSLLALDISANFLGALPPALGLCVNLEELNIASNPLRALPVFLGGMVSLRVLIVDSTGISSLPEALSSLEKLHTLSVRRNKLHILPSWLCLLPSLETLLVDGNPFLGPWKALMEPLLSQSPTTPIYPPSTPMFPLSSATASVRSTTTEDTDVEDDNSSDREIHDSPAVIEDEDTITAALRSPPIQRSITSPLPSAVPPVPPPPPKLARTRTTPNRTYFEKSRSGSIKASGTASASSSRPPSSKGPKDERELRKMKSAGELRGKAGITRSRTQSSTAPPQRSAISAYVSSPSSSNLLDAPSVPLPSPMPDGSIPKRFASLGATSGAMASQAPSSSRQRPQLDGSVWERNSSESHPVPSEPPVSLESRLRRATLSKSSPDSPRPDSRPDSEYSRAALPPLPHMSGKPSRWGFLKKMSMGKMRIDASPSLKASVGGHSRPQIRTAGSSPNIPHLDVRISTTGSLRRPGAGAGLPQEALPTSMSRKSSSESLTPPEVPEKPHLDMLKVPSPSTVTHLLVPGALPSSRATKRRSFLPIDFPSIPIPSPTSFLPAVTASNAADDADDMDGEPPSPLPKDTAEEIQRREEERAREVRLRALRSVMAYLRDMHDLGQSQANVLSMYGGAPPEASGLRSRRPTMVDNGRVPSENSIGSAGSIASSRPESSAPSSAHLRSPETRIALRSGATTATNSVASNNSDGSTEERKFKDDKGKRTMIVREIVETERTYVKGLQELVDIYITPASAFINSIGSQKQETVVPASERKTVFQGLEALHIFHRDSFLPALERVTAPLLGPAANPAVDRDPDGTLSLEVARKVAQTFVSQAAFMKMYSTYINNFDNSVQRIRQWLSDRPQTPSATSPSSSSAQLAGLGLSMTAVAGGVMPDQAATASPLSSSQRKRIKQYLKRCRMNPRHSQLNLEGYLLLPVQRIPRYRLLLEELSRSSIPMYDFGDDPIDRALAEISSIATSMNEGKRESESRRRLVAWQSRIRGKFPSPLVQPHRRLIMDGRLHLTRVIRKRSLSFEVIDAQGDAAEVSVECLEPELTPRPLIGILCNDLLVLCRDSSDGQDPNSMVDLWAVLRMQTLPQPATIVHGNTLRLVDNKAILYFEAPSTSDALTWYRAINLHIPASKA